MDIDRIRQALQYIDDHLDQPLTCADVAGALHFSHFYFHRVFSAVVGKTITAHIRERRLGKACRFLAQTRLPILEVCLSSGFDSPQAFARTFKSAYGVSPSAYRKGGFLPEALTVDELIQRFTNRLKGGILVHPKLIKRGKLFIAGLTGDGNQTGVLWEKFMAMKETNRILNKVSDNGYEIRFYPGDDHCDCHVGVAVPDTKVDPVYQVVKLPAAEYASFDVYVANGYGSENPAMEEWLAGNDLGYRERLLDGRHYCMEFYDERFHGEEKGSIVEIWIPIEKA